MSTLHQNPKYNGTHACPECGAKSHWTLVSETPAVVRVECDGDCDTYEKPLAELERMQYYNSPIQKPAKVGH